MMSSGWQMEAPTESTRPAWVAMRHSLWPETTAEENLQETQEMMANASRFFVRIAQNAEGRPAAFAEATLRTDYVNGCETSPVAFLEGIYVEPWARRQGVARSLVLAVETWARQHACSELASDALLDNDSSHRMHQGLGFAETERVVCFRKEIA